MARYLLNTLMSVIELCFQICVNANLQMCHLLDKYIRTFTQ
jgi:hypothetical protein